MQHTKRICVALVLTLLGTGIAAADRQPTQDDQSQQRDQDQQRPPSDQQRPPQGEQTPRGQQPQGEVMAQKTTLTATVDEVDVKNRKLVLRNKQGNQVR